MTKNFTDYKYMIFKKKIDDVSYITRSMRWINISSKLKDSYKLIYHNNIIAVCHSSIVNFNILLFMINILYDNTIIVGLIDDCTIKEYDLISFYDLVGSDYIIKKIYNKKIPPDFIPHQWAKYQPELGLMLKLQ